MTVVGVGNHVHRTLGAIGTDGLQHETSIGRRLLFFAVKLHFELAARGIHDRAGAIPAVVAESRVLFKFLFGDAFLVDVRLAPPFIMASTRARCSGGILAKASGGRFGMAGIRSWNESRSFPTDLP
jgi:hypothetical protein